MRSRPGYAVNGIAETFGGGGHKEAAGCIISAKDIKQAKKQVIKAMREYLKRRTANEK